MRVESGKGTLAWSPIWSPQNTPRLLDSPIDMGHNNSSPRQVHHQKYSETEPDQVVLTRRSNNDGLGRDPPKAPAHSMDFLLHRTSVCELGAFPRPQPPLWLQPW